MIYLIVTLLIYILCVSIHISICRSLKENILLVKKFLVIAAVGFLADWAVFFFLSRSFTSDPSLLTLPLQWTSTVIFLLLTIIYLIFYVNTKLVSPSKKVLTLIRSSSNMTEEILSRFFSDEEFILSRLSDLENSGCIEFKDGRYRLLAAGKRIGKIMEGYQKLLGREMGG